jgi:hypothetical protein
MARPRTALGESVDAEIALRAARGESAETIYWAIGRTVSARTIRRRVAETRPRRESVCPTCGRPRTNMETASVKE